MLRNNILLRRLAIPKKYNCQKAEYFMQNIKKGFKNCLTLNSKGWKDLRKENRSMKTAKAKKPKTSSKI